jgi:hypothetical protein
MRRRGVVMQVGWSRSSRKAQFCRSAMPLWLIFPTLTGERYVIKRNRCVQNLHKKKKNQLVDYLVSTNPRRVSLETEELPFVLKTFFFKEKKNQIYCFLKKNNWMKLDLHSLSLKIPSDPLIVLSALGNELFEIMF